MKRIKRIKYFLIVLALFASCTKLDKKDVLYDTVIQDNFLKTDAELASAVAAAYTPLYGFGGNNHQIPLNEVTTDEVVVPTKGPDWGDGGRRGVPGVARPRGTSRRATANQSLQPRGGSVMFFTATPITLFSLPSTLRRYMSWIGACALVSASDPRGLSSFADSIAFTRSARLERSPLTALAPAIRSCAAS